MQLQLIKAHYRTPGNRLSNGGMPGEGGRPSEQADRNSGLNGRRPRLTLVMPEQAAVAGDVLEELEGQEAHTEVEGGVADQEQDIAGRKL